MKRIKLGDVLDVRRGASLSGDYYAEDGTFVRLTLGNFNYPNGGFKENTSKTDIYYTGPARKEFILKKGDIITPLTEQVAGLLGETATIPEDNRYIQCGDIGLIIPDNTKLSRRFAYYLVSSPAVKKQLGAAAQQTKIRHTSPDSIKACEAWIPEQVQEQEKIAAILDNINAAISNNTAICSDLEALAKLLYDYWFVQFDFPDENGKPYKTSGGKMVWNEELKREIPEEWNTTKIGNVCQVLLGGTPDTNNPEYWNGEIPWLNSGEVAVSPVLFAEKTITEKGMNESATSFAKAGAVVMSITRYIRPSILGIDSCFNQSVVAVLPTDKYRTAYLYPVMKANVPMYMSLRTGAQQPHINKETVENTIIICPTDDVLNRYNQIVDPLYTEQINTAKETAQLQELRDFLLPMLMNGQVKIKE